MKEKTVRNKIRRFLLRILDCEGNDAFLIGSVLEREAFDELSGLDLSLVQSFKRNKDGGFEVKLYDRLEAAQMLLALMNEEKSPEDVLSFYREACAG